MRVNGLPFALVAFCSGASILSGQAFADHAAAIAGASAGVAGATAIRDPLSRILDAASGAAGTAAAESPRPDKKPARSASATSISGPAATAPQFSAAPSTPGAVAGRHTWRRGSEGRSVFPADQQSYDRYERQEPVFQATVAQLRTIAPGASQADLAGRLGTPASRISMDDNGHLVEILEYASSSGNRVGSVRCSDGHVESVNAAQ